jgi:hypothetical protein
VIRHMICCGRRYAMAEGWTVFLNVFIQFRIGENHQIPSRGSRPVVGTYPMRTSGPSDRLRPILRQPEANRAAVTEGNGLGGNMLRVGSTVESTRRAKRESASSDRRFVSSIACASASSLLHQHSAVYPGTSHPG